jgi:hypothetical protein
MLKYNSDFERLKEDFIKKSIDISKPGFYDDPNFLVVEQRNPDYLVNYANYVKKMNYDSNYLISSKRKIEIISKILFDELWKDGRKGACIDLSMVLSRILEKEGIWNYMVSGTLTIEYPTETGLGKTYFWDMDITNAQAGHVWIVSPPFAVIDLTLKIQEYNQNNSKYIPNYILGDSPKPANYTVGDICSPEIIAIANSQNINGDEIIFRTHPWRRIFYKEFIGSLIEVDGVKFKYIPSAIKASDKPLEQITTLSLNSKYGCGIYNDLIKPNL